MGSRRMGLSMGNAYEGGCGLCRGSERGWKNGYRTDWTFQLEEQEVKEGIHTRSTLRDVFDQVLGASRKALYYLEYQLDLIQLIWSLQPCQTIVLPRSQRSKDIMASSLFGSFGDLRDEGIRLGGNGRDL